MQQWTNYFSVTAGCAATLTGLIFVSVSLNLQRILATKHLPDRALGALALLANILVISSFLLIPGQSLCWLGCEILVLDGVLWVLIIRLDFKMYKGAEKRFKPKYRQNIFFSQVALLPFLAAGIFLIIVIFEYNHF